MFPYNGYLFTFSCCLVLVVIIFYYVHFFMEGGTFLKHSHSSAVALFKLWGTFL